MCTDEQHNQKQLASLDKIEKHLKHRVDRDTHVAISATKGFILDYQDRHYLYVWSSVAFILDLGLLGLIPIVAHNWTALNFIEGTKVFALNQTNDLTVLTRATDVVQPSTKDASYVGVPLAPLSTNPTQTAAAGADTVLVFGPNGKTPFNHAVIQNNTAASIFYAFDQSSVTSGNEIYTLAAASLIFWDRSSSGALHFSSAAQQSFGGQTGITVEVFI